MKKITLVADGACKGNPGPGGWATLLRYGETERILSGSEPATTNNRQELRAVIEGFRVLKEPCEVEVISDSKYVLDPFNKGWLKKWVVNGWTNTSGAVKNADLWKELLALTTDHVVTWTWVKGHSGHVDNERVDQLAQAEALACA